MTSLIQGDWPWKQPSVPITRGAFIVVEGLDRAGKTTQVKRLCDRLYSLGYNVKAIRFPDRASPIGQMINSYLQNSVDMDDHTAHLLFSANRWEKAKWIVDTLSAGYTIVCDRYTLSGIAYSTAKNNPSLSLEWAKAPDVGLPCPDAIVFLNIPLEEVEKRDGFGVEKYEKKELQKDIRGVFLHLLSTVPYESCIQIIDAGQPMSTVECQILAAISDTVSSVVSGASGKQIKRISAG